MFKTEKWVFSEEVETEIPKGLSPGMHCLYIEDQAFDAESQKYTLFLHAIDTDEKGRMSWFLQKKDGTKNQYAINTLISLGTALQGQPIGVPYADSVKHGLVTGEVVMSPPKFSEQHGKEMSYANVYKFDMADAQDYLTLKGMDFPLISQTLKGQDGNPIDSDSLDG